MPTITSLAQVVGDLSHEDLKPAADALATFQATANHFTAKVAEITGNPDYTDSGKQKLVATARESLTKMVSRVQDQLTRAMELQSARIAKAQADANRLPDLGPDAPVVTLLQLERLRNMEPGELVAEYETAVNEGDALLRRSCEAVAGKVLRGDGNLEHQVRFQTLKAEVNKPSAVQAEAEDRLAILRKAESVMNYCLDELAEGKGLPFVGEEVSSNA